MTTKCSNCGKLIEPVFKIDAGIDRLVCPECGCILGACTDNIQVIGKDM
ncbi:MAG: hypothetical protein NWF01_05010 [Candidatus Bathyarchaeota archaeon]|nr:hypothetical protein [Candidatus Bathyarchaeota archaeon]